MLLISKTVNKIFNIKTKHLSAFFSSVCGPPTTRNEDHPINRVSIYISRGTRHCNRLETDGPVNINFFFSLFTESCRNSCHLFTVGQYYGEMKDLGFHLIRFD